MTITALAWALVHFAWQGAAIAVVAGSADAALRRARASVRYAVLCGGLGAMLLAPAITFFVLRLPHAGAPAPLIAAPVLPAPSFTAGLPAGPSSGGPASLEWVVWIWLAGVTILGARSAGGWMWAQRLRSNRTSAVASSVLRAAADLRERLGIRRVVRVLGTAAAEVPTSIGWLRPVVLLPVSVLTALTPEQIELLIAHELAHVRRHDYLVNLAQTAVETLLFYHPAVWWISGRIRAERENCCDDLAVDACGKVDQYVRALASLEGLRARRPGMAIAADGGSLLHRIRRLVNRGREERTSPRAWVGAFVPAAVILGAVVSAAAPHAAARRAAAAPHETAAPLGRIIPTEAAALPVTTAPTDAAASTRATAPHATASAPSTTAPIEATLPPAATAPPAAEQPKAVSTPPAAATPPQAPAPRPAAAPTSSRPGPGAPAVGFLGELTDSGYPKLSVDEIIALKEHGVEPRYVKGLLSAGLGVPGVDEVIKLHDHGVEPVFVASMVKSGLVGDLDFANVIDLRENDARGDDMSRIRALGFGPFTAREVIRLRQNGVDAGSFDALVQAGASRAGVDDAIAFRQNDVTTERIRDMKRQGFHDLSVEQILKLRRSGVI